MSRKAAPPDSDSGNVFDYGIIGGNDFANAYHRPTSETPRWQLPDSKQIVTDFERCGGDLSIFLGAILPDDGERAKQVLMTCIVRKLKDEEEFEEFEKIKNAGEEARLYMIEERAFTMAGYDASALKFILQARRSNKFGKAATEENNDVVDQLKKVQQLLRGNSSE